MFAAMNRRGAGLETRFGVRHFQSPSDAVAGACQVPKVDTVISVAKLFAHSPVGFGDIWRARVESGSPDHEFSFR
jgi:hypothetical protein